MKGRGLQAKLRRRELTRLADAINELPLSSPRKGWISSIRNAIGMTGQQLARRLGIDPSAVSRLETSEAKRTITLSHLDRAAEALGCRVVYALVPHTPLDDTLHSRARAAARRLRKPVAHSMKLEDQSLDGDAARDREELLADDLIMKLDPILWEDES